MLDRPATFLIGVRLRTSTLAGGAIGATGALVTGWSLDTSTMGAGLLGFIAASCCALTILLAAFKPPVGFGVGLVPRRFPTNAEPRFFHCALIGAIVGVVVPVVVAAAFPAAAPVSAVCVGLVVSAPAMPVVSPVAAVGKVVAETWPKPPAGAVETVVATVGFVGVPVSADVTTGCSDVSVVDART